MKLISCDALRTLHLPDIHYIKPEQLLAETALIQQADWVLFPQYWQLPPLLHALKARIFPSLASYMIGHSKVEMSRTFQALEPAHVPFTLIEANTAQNADRIWERMPHPFVAKIPKSSMGQGVFLIETPLQWRAYLESSPVIYVQEYLPIDRDLRIIWAGDKLIGGYWRLQAPQGFYNNVSQGGTVEHALVPREACELVTRLATRLGIDYGGFDVAMVGSHPYVIEYNRLFGNSGAGDLRAQIDAEILRYLATGQECDTPNPPLPQIEVS